MNADDQANDANGLTGDLETGRVASEGDRCPVGDFRLVLQQVMEYAGGDRALAAEWLPCRQRAYHFQAGGDRAVAAEWLGISSDTLELLLCEQGGHGLREALYSHV